MHIDVIKPPKGRTFAAIRRSRMAEAARNSTAVRSDTNRQAMQAMRYVEEMCGSETPHSYCYGLRYGAAPHVRFDKAPDRSRRVRYVWPGTSDEREIPHWDFVPCVFEEHAP